MEKLADVEFPYAQRELFAGGEITMYIEIEDEGMAIRSGRLDQCGVAQMLERRIVQIPSVLVRIQ